MAVRRMDEHGWQELLYEISESKCTPFIGAGIGPNPLAWEIAVEWAEEYGYPLPDRSDLARVAQFVAVVRRGSAIPKQRLLRQLRKTTPPDYHDPAEPHGVLADLPFSMYLTTNYDGFMTEALRTRSKDPVRVVCRWHREIAPPDTSTPPSETTPWVFHLHGSDRDEHELVLTEDDYVDFLVAAMRDQSVLDHYVERALHNTSLLFIGYSLADWTFRVLFRGIVSPIGSPLVRRHIAVQLPPDTAAQDYLERYFNEMNVQVYWGDAREFVTELRSKWDAYRAGPGAA